jgi:type IV pilus assembly protein PilY1
VHTSLNIPAPITGQPKAFPDTTGAVADRIFVGDRDGRLWRVDVSSKNPADWSMQVFFDAFYDNPSAGPQPVVLPPALSTDDEGRVTVAFATGDQQVVAAPATMVNRVFSLTEKLNPSHAFVANVNWMQTLTDGYRVTGPMQIFNKGLYYAASKPPDATGKTCHRGAAKIFGAHYIESADEDHTDPASGPANSPAFPDKLQIDAVDPGVVFGLNVQPDPTCKSTATNVTGDDSFGYGSIQMARQVSPGKFFLNYTVSGVRTDAGGTSDTTQDVSRGLTDVKTELPPPHVPVTFQSWALIYE